MDNDKIREVKTETVDLTMQLAKHFDRMPTLKGDRDPDTPIGKKRVAQLHSLLAMGLFYSPSWATVVVKSDRRKKYRVDGGHSSRMLVQCGDSFPEGLKVTIKEFEASDIYSAVDLYEQFNQQFSVRTKSDLIKNKAAYETQLEGLTPTAIAICLRGIEFHLRLAEDYKSTGDINLIRVFPDFIAWASRFSKNKQFRRTGIMGAIFATYGKAEDACREFWDMIDTERAEDAADPTRVYARWVLQAAADAARGRQSEWAPRAYYVKACHAWNAWRKGDTTSLKYHSAAPIPKLL